MEKDKKKTIISMVVAVTFLVLLVVGATYAYFQASNNASGTTNLTAETTKIGNVIVTNPTENLYLKLSAYEMQESKKNYSYYAVDEEPTGKTAYKESLYGSPFDVPTYSVAQAQVVGGDPKSLYSCSFNLKVTKPSVLKPGDMTFYIGMKESGSNSKVSDVTFDGTNYEAYLYNYGLDLYSLSTYNKVTFNISGDASDLSNVLKIGLGLSNKNSDQSHLAGQDLGVSITLSDLECNVVDGISFYAYDANNNLIKTYYKGVANIEEDRIGGPIYHLSSLNVDKVVIAEGITKIGVWQFEIESFSRLELPSSLRTISRSAFADNSKLTSVTIPNGVTTIGENAFGNTGLTSLHIPASVTSIGSLGTLNSLATLTVDANNTVYESKNNYLIEKENQRLVAAAKGITSFPEGIKIIGTGSLSGLTLSSLTIPGGVETIENGGFSFVTISEIVFEDGLKTIGERAFEYNMSLQSIVLPKSLTSIGSEAFWSTNGLTINYRGSEEEWNAIDKDSDWNMAAADYTIVYNYTG